MKQKSLFKNTVYKAILSFVNILAPVIIGSYIVKLLDINLYGTYNKVYADFQVFLTFASFGIYTFGVKELSKVRDNKEKISVLFTNLFVIMLLSNFITVVIYVLYAMLCSKGISTAIYLLFTIELFGNAFYVEFLNEALENYGFITLKSLIIKILYMISLVIFVKKSTDILIYTIIVSLTNLLNNVVSFIYAKRFIKFDFKKLKIKEFIKPLFTVFIISNIGLLYSQLDKVMLGHFGTEVFVTMYYIPYYLMGTLSSIPYSIINVSIPRLSYLLEQNGKEQYLEKLSQSISTLFFFIMPICMGVFVVARETIILYAGEKYISMVGVLLIACVSRIIISIESIMTNLVSYPNNQENKIMTFSLIGGALNLIMNFGLVLINAFSPATALITTTISEFILCIFQYFNAKKKLKLSIHIFTKKNIIYFILSFIFIPISIIIRLLHLTFWPNLILIILLCLFEYIGILFIIKDQNLFFILNKLLGKIFIKKGSAKK